MEKGYLSFVLHAHLPFVRHPEYESFLEEDWFYEGVIETYMPLIHMIDNLLSDGVDFSITISLSPTLMAMFDDTLLNYRLKEKLEALMELSAKEIERTKNEYQVSELSKMYNRIYKQTYHTYLNKYDGNILNAFKKFDKSGKVEIITCGATHAFLPFWEMYPEAVNAQIETAVNSFKKVFGHTPVGIWLPECGYFYDLDKVLKKFGIRYFLLDTQGVLFSEPKPVFGVYSPCLCKSGVAVFARDVESSKAVWSKEEGYPGDCNYRDFYRDIGYDLDYDYIKPYLHGDGIRTSIGIKYHSITGKSDYKQYYNPEKAMEIVDSHAFNFVFNRTHQVNYLFDKIGRKPIIVSPYDAELFGHWWFEGVSWLDKVIRMTEKDQNIFKLITPSEYLLLYEEYQEIIPSPSSWGWKGYNEVWLNGSNDWIYPYIHSMAEQMIQLSSRFPNSSGIQEKALNQLARELLLAQSSDWPFMMKTNICCNYAIRRIKDHISGFDKIYTMIKEDNIDEGWIQKRFLKYNVFPDLDYKIYNKKACYGYI